MSENLDQTNPKEGDALLSERPQESGYNALLSSGRQKHYYGSGASQILIFVPTVVILSIYDESCVKPIREWLTVIAVVSGVFTFAGCSESCFNGMSRLGVSASILYSLLALFTLAWYIVGSVWLFKDGSCYDDWQAGYVLTLVLLILFYIAMGMIVLVACCCVCCIGAIAGIGAAAATSESKA